MNLLRAPHSSYHLLPSCEGDDAAAAVGAPPWATAIIAGQAELKTGLADLKTGLAELRAKQLNRTVNLPDDPIEPLRGHAAPHLLPAAVLPHPLYFPPTLQALAVATHLQLEALLNFYGLAAMLAAGPGGHAAEVRSAVHRLGTFLGVAMAGSRERTEQLQLVRASNLSAHIHEHVLHPPRGAFPPFFLPAEADIVFPETAGAFQITSLAEAQALSSFYGLAAHHGAHELRSRLGDIARHIGYRW